MTNLILENIPDELIEQIKQLAQQQDLSVNEQIISILKQVLQKHQSTLKFVISPETDPSWEERRKATPKILAEIRHRRRVNPIEFGLPDSTQLIRADRDR